MHIKKRIVSLNFLELLYHLIRMRAAQQAMSKKQDIIEL